jgi:ketosteroid isomerase-like protein
VACYAPAAVLWGPDEAVARGTAAIREAYRGMLAGNTVKDASLTNVEHRQSGNLSAGWGRFTLTLVPKAGGAPVVMRGRFTEVAEKHDGEWLYVADHASAEPARPAPK